MKCWPILGMESLKNTTYKEKNWTLIVVTKVFDKIFTDFLQYSPQGPNYDWHCHENLVVGFLVHVFVHYDYSLHHLKQIQVYKKNTKSAKNIQLFHWCRNHWQKQGHLSWTPPFRWWCLVTLYGYQHKSFFNIWQQNEGDIPESFLLALILSWFFSLLYHFNVFCAIAVILFPDFPLFMFKNVSCLSYFILCNIFLNCGFIWL